MFAFSININFIGRILPFREFFFEFKILEFIQKLKTEWGGEKGGFSFDESDSLSLKNNNYSHHNNIEEMFNSVNEIEANEAETTSNIFLIKI